MRCSPFYDACKWRAKPFALIASQILPRRERFTAAARKALQSRDALEGQLGSQLDYLRADRREIRLEGRIAASAFAWGVEPWKRRTLARS